jgi:hypothetical protein
VSRLRSPGGAAPVGRLRPGATKNHESITYLGAQAAGVLAGPNQVLEDRLDLEGIFKEGSKHGNK